MFKVTEETIDPAILMKALSDHSAGAIITFEGRVRNHNEGKTVDYLEYHTYQALAVKEGKRILEKALSGFDIVKAGAVHRSGRLYPGDIAVWVGVAGAHRDAAFAACRYIIDEVKKTVPIWKKEFFAEGTPKWTHAESG